MKYYLYLDEMLENLQTGVNFFSLAGFAISEIEREILDDKFDILKNKHNIKILHWTEIRRFRGVWKNKKENDIKSFLKDFYSIIKNGDITVFASMYDVELITSNIKSKKWLSHRHIYCMKKIFENFFIFLNRKNSYEENVEGHIIVESSSTDEELKRLFHSIMIFGTDFVSPQGLSKFIKSMEFISKSDNNNLLQIADPMPSELYRLKIDNQNFSKRLEPYKVEFHNLREIIYKKQFKGYTNREDLFGIYILK